MQNNWNQRMTGYKSIAVAGGLGSFGSKIVQALLDQGYPQVKVLTRKNQSHPNPNVTVVAVDYADTKSLINALTGVDVVISALNDYATLGPQLALIEASKITGVKRFVPSEYVTDTTEKNEPVWEPSRSLVNSLKESGLPYTIYQNGLFMEYVMSPMFGIDVSTGSITLYGSGNTKVDITSAKDVARFIAYTIGDTKSENRTYHVAGERLTMNEIVSELVEVTKITPVITRQELADLTHLEDYESEEYIHEHARFEAENGGFRQAAISNSEYPDFRFRTFHEFLHDTPLDK
ncbi:NAD(P)-binding protein [Basidiobolus meristosporus CBS 931.73]|uniref:NAD(P)-binding protein n=1 Tax=Basidiobolus meristosporus CBS 931.73 TaxID=1314790 RepID=A0A1Y1XZZ3_9FUNG|nr:NAD(P)-binding protein [Basidiobolus meristosporus CBS 931.73]|eukprot:ORX91311.1 NAD(P)-binding protein [Basidiobolus meristosporus CBS 931.73]